MPRAPMLAALLAIVVSTAPSGAQAGATGQPPAQSAPFDVLITGGRIIDGTGNPFFYADVGIRDGRVASFGAVQAARATRVINARGMIVAPGFIDIHSHADDGASARGGFRDPDARRRAAPKLVAQGVTTVVVNHDGRSPLPIRDQRAFLEKNGIGPNAMLMVGHGTVRREVMGTDFQRAATPAEVQRMRALVRG